MQTVPVKPVKLGGAFFSNRTPSINLCNALLTELRDTFYFVRSDFFFSARTKRSAENILNSRAEILVTEGPW